MLEPAKLKIIQQRGNLEIRDFKYPKTISTKRTKSHNLEYFQ